MVSLLDQVWEQLGYHAKGGDTPQKTIQRLLLKHCQKHFCWSLKHALQNDTLTAMSETRTKEELDKLWRVHGRTIVGGSADLPPVILRIGDHEFIIDGNTRINKRVAESDPGPHSMIVVEATQVKWNPST